IALRDPRWSLLDAVLADVQNKHKTQVATLASFNQVLFEVGPKVDQLRRELDTASNFKAATVRERDRLQQISRRNEQANASVKARCAQAYEDVDLVAQEARQFDDLLAAVRAKTEDATKIRRQSDLFLLRSPLDAQNLFHYDALLRTASEAGVFGVSLQAS